MNGLQWLAPWSLLALIPLAAAIIVLYLLRLRRRELTISSTFLWRRAVQDMQANVPFQRLRRNLLLLLQLLALLLLLVGLAGPFFLSRRAGGNSVVIVLDASASMTATDVRGSRFEEARRQALALMKGLRRNDEAAVVTCALRPRVDLPFSRDRRRLGAVLSAAQPQDCSTNIRDGMLLALSLAAKRKQADIYLFSDGAFPPLPPLTSPARIHFTCLGKRSDNVAIISFGTSRPRGKQAHQVFIRVRNFSALPKSAVLSLYREAEVLRVEKLELAAGATHTATYETQLANPGLLKAELDVADDLRADNVAYAVPEDEGLLNVLLVSPGNLFLEQALVVLPQVSLYKAARISADELAQAVRDHDVVILDRSAPATLPATGGLLVLGSGDVASITTAAATLPTPRLTEWERSHPLLQHVDLNMLAIQEARALAPVGVTRPLAWSNDSPLLVSQDAGRRRAIVCGFDILDTDWPLRVSFPIFMSNAVNWLGEARLRNRTSVMRPGQIIRSALPTGQSKATLTLPDGRRQPLNVSTGEAIISETGRVGLYSLRSGDITRRWAADLRDPAESDLTPKRDLKIGEARVVQGAPAPQREQHLWPWLALLALGLLLAEWHIYHRRY